MAGRIISGKRETSAAELAERSARAAEGLASLGLQPGDTVATVLRNDFACFEAAAAASLLGASPVPVNWHFPAEEAGHVFRDCGARAIVLHADLFAELGAALPQGVPRFIVPTPPEIQRAYTIPAERRALPASAAPWESGKPSGGARPPDPSDPSDPRLLADPAVVCTAGATGPPKPVRFEAETPEQARAGRAVHDAVFGIRGPVTTVIAGPLYYAETAAYAVHALRHGGTLVLMPRFEPEALLALIQKHQVTHLHMVPAMFRRLLRLPEDVRRRYDVSSLEVVVHTAAPCPAHVKRAMIDWWGPVLNEYYGATETGPIALCTSEEWLAHPGTVGRLLPGVRLKVVDASGEDVRRGETGEIYCRLPIGRDYTYQGDDRRRREAERDGLVTVGDIGYLGPQDYLYLCDRRPNVVVAGGVTIFPSEVEAELLRLEGVRDCAVFGIPDDDLGEALCAVVEPEFDARIAEPEVQAFLGGRLAGYKIPKVVVFSNKLPRDESGKMFKQKLKAPYWNAPRRRI